MSVPPSERDPALVLEHAPYVRALARALVFDRQLARDLEQEVLLAALENAPRDPRSIKGWLSAVVRNLASKAFRSGARRSEREQQAAVREDAVAPTTGDAIYFDDRADPPSLGIRVGKARPNGEPPTRTWVLQTDVHGKTRRWSLGASPRWCLTRRARGRATGSRRRATAATPRRSPPRVRSCAMRSSVTCAR